MWFSIHNWWTIVRSLENKVINIMKIFYCNAQGNPISTPRYWYDPWGLIAEMIFLIVGAIFLLVIDIAEHFMGVKSMSDVMYAFKERLSMAYDTVPYYLKHIKMR